MAEQSIIEADAASALLRAGLPMAAVDCMIAFAKAKGTELRYKRLLREAREHLAVIDGPAGRAASGLLAAIDKELG